MPNFVKKVPTPIIENVEEKFNSIFDNFLNLLKKINFDKFKEKRSINLDQDILLKIYDYVVELSNPKYQKMLENIAIPTRPSPTSKLPDFETELNNTDYKIKSIHFIRELIKAFSVYNNPEIRNYFFALSTCLTDVYSSSNPGSESKVVIRFKAIKDIILKLANNIFLDGTFESYRNEKQPELNTDTFKFEPLHDVFGIKLILVSDTSQENSSDKDLLNEINKEKSLLSELGSYDLFSEKLKKSPNSITSRYYLSSCEFIVKAIIGYYTIKCTNKKSLKNKNSIISHYQKQLDKIKSAYDSVGVDDPLIPSIQNQFNFQNLLAKYKRMISAPFSLTKATKQLNSILNFSNLSNPPDKSYLIKFFQIEGLNLEEMHTSSGHEGVHYDIKTPYGIIELQVQTKPQYESDKHGPTSSHGLMENKQLPKFPFPSEVTEIDVFPEASPKYLKLEYSDGRCYYYKKDDVKKFMKLIDLYIAKKGTIEYDTSCITLTMNSSYKNYCENLSEIPEEKSDDPKINKIIEDYRNRLSLLILKPSEFLDVFFSPNSNTTSYWTKEKIAMFLSSHKFPDKNGSDQPVQ